MIQKTDFKKDLGAYRAKLREFRIVEVPDLQYLMIDGAGDPNTSPAFGHAVEALYPVAYKLKYSSKRDLGRDYVVPPLEGLWWARNMDSFTASRDKSLWDWTLMIMVPYWIDQSLFAAAVEQTGATNRPARLGELRLEPLCEGRCVQTLHIGPYDDEADLLARMHNEFIPTNGFRMVGKHHEIYLSDARRVAPDKVRTILRQPVRATDKPYR